MICGVFSLVAAAILELTNRGSSFGSLILGLGRGLVFGLGFTPF